MSSYTIPNLASADIISSYPTGFFTSIPSANFFILGFNSELKISDFDIAAQALIEFICESLRVSPLKTSIIACLNQTINSA